MQWHGIRGRRQGLRCASRIEAGTPYEEAGDGPKKTVKELMEAIVGTEKGLLLKWAVDA